MPKKVSTASARSVLAHAQALIDGALIPPPGLDKSLIRQARQEQAAPDVAGPYEAATQAWEESRRLTQATQAQADQSQEAALDAHSRYNKVRSTVAHSYDMLEARSELDNAQARTVACLYSRTLAKNDWGRHASDFDQLVWPRDTVAQTYHRALRRGTPGALLGTLARVLRVDTLSRDLKASYEEYEKMTLQLETATDNQEKAREHLERSITAHPSVVAAQEEKEKATRSRGLAVRHLNEAVHAEQALSSALMEITHDRWRQPAFLALAYAVADLSPDVRRTFKDELDRLSGKSAPVTSSARTRVAGASSPITTTAAPSSSMNNTTLLWWMLLYPEPGTQSASDQKQCNAHLGEFAQDSTLVDRCLASDPAGQFSVVESHAPAGYYQGYSDHAPSHSSVSDNYSSLSSHYDHSSSSSSHDSSSSPSSSFD